MHRLNVSSAQLLFKEALKTFGHCLHANSNQLEIRNLKDFYRIREIPRHCCQYLATSLLPNNLVKSVEKIDTGNCRINAFFIPDSVFDPHNHPFHFISYVVFGGYTHTIFNKVSDIVGNKTDNTYQPCVQRTHQIIHRAQQN